MLYSIEDFAARDDLNNTYSNGYIRNGKSPDIATTNRANNQYNYILHRMAKKYKIGTPSQTKEDMANANNALAKLNNAMKNRTNNLKLMHQAGRLSASRSAMGLSHPESNAKIKDRAWATLTSPNKPVRYNSKLIDIYNYIRNKK